MKKQKAIIVCTPNDRPDSKGGTEELNGLLSQGWRVIIATGMGGGGQNTNCYSLVILEKEE